MVLGAAGAVLALGTGCSGWTALLAYSGAGSAGMLLAAGHVLVRPA